MYANSIYLIVEDQDYRVELHENHSILYVIWKRHLEGEALYEKYLNLLNIVVQFQPRKWLGNARAIYYTTLQDSRWIIESFIPQLIESSITKYARLESPRSLLMLDSVRLLDKVKHLTQGISDKFEFQFFTDEEQAIGWLTS